MPQPLPDDIKAAEAYAAETEWPDVMGVGPAFTRLWAMQRIAELELECQERLKDSQCLAECYMELLIALNAVVDGMHCSDAVKAQIRSGTRACTATVNQILALQHKAL